MKVKYAKPAKGGLNVYDKALKKGIDPDEYFKCPYCGEKLPTMQDFYILACVNFKCQQLYYTIQPRMLDIAYEQRKTLTK